MNLASIFLLSEFGDIHLQLQNIKTATLIGGITGVYSTLTAFLYKFPFNLHHT